MADDEIVYSKRSAERFRIRETYTEQRGKACITAMAESLTDSLYTLHSTRARDHGDECSAKPRFYVE